MTRCTTADCFRLDVSLIRTARTNGWRVGAITWTWFGQKYRLSWLLDTRDGRPCLLHRWGEWEPGKQEAYAAYFEQVPSPVGGHRHFWRCLCGRRVTALFCPRGNLNWPGHRPVFACRHCYDLPYGSQYESASDRTWRRYHALFDELRNPKTRPRRLLAVSRLLHGSVMPVIDAQHDQFMKRVDRSLGRATAPLAIKLPRGRPSKRMLRAIRQLRREHARGPRPARPPGRPREKRRYTRKMPVVLATEKKDRGQAYCPRCHDRRDMRNRRVITFSNGRPAEQGECAECGARMARIITRAQARPR